MKELADRYGERVEDELFNATYDEAIEFLDELIDYLGAMRKEFYNIKREFE